MSNPENPENAETKPTTDSEPESRDADGWYTQGTALVKNNKLSEALKAFRKAIELNPNKATYWNHLSLALIELEEIEEAETAARRAIHLEPDEVKHWVTLETIHDHILSWEKAKKEYKQLLLGWIPAVEKYIGTDTLSYFETEDLLRMKREIKLLLDDLETLDGSDLNRRARFKHEFLDLEDEIQETFSYLKYE